MKKLLSIFGVCFLIITHAAAQVVTQRSSRFSFAKPATLSLRVTSPPNDAELTATPAMIEGVIIHHQKLTAFRINDVPANLQEGLKIVGTSQKPNVPDTTKFSYQIDLQPGENRIRLEAVNSAGETASRELTLRANLSSGRLPESYAVIIGIGDYADPAIRDLKYAVNDAKALYNLLIDPRYGGFKKDNVKLLLDKQATVSNIKSAIGTWLPKTVSKNSTVVIFFAGHGAPERDQTYWVTCETQSQDLYATALSNDTIAEMLARIETERLITFLDCCYSAATINRTTNMRNLDDPFKALKGKGRLTITASDGKQLSLEDDAFKHGIFTYRLLEGLTGKSDKDEDGVVVVEELWAYVKDSVVADARQRSHKQEPTLIGTITGSIPLARNPAVLQEKPKAVFFQLYRDKKIAEETYERLKRIIEGQPSPDLESKQRAIRDYMDKKIELATLIELVDK